MEPPKLKGPLSATPIEGDTVWVTRDGDWVIVRRTTWDATAARRPLPARRPDTDLGLGLGTDRPSSSGSSRRGPRTEPEVVDGVPQPADPSRLGLWLVAGIVGAAMAAILATAVGWVVTAEPPAPVAAPGSLQPVDVRDAPPPRMVLPGQPRPSPIAAPGSLPPVAAQGGTDTGTDPATLSSQFVVGTPDQIAARPDLPTLQVPTPALPAAGTGPGWAVHVAIGWRRLGADPTQAAHRFRRALALNPSLAEAQLGLGLALVRQGRSRGAAVRLCEAARMDAQYVDEATIALAAIGETCPPTP